jgi:hypothetical protein
MFERLVDHDKVCCTANAVAGDDYAQVNLGGDRGGSGNDDGECFGSDD